MLKRREEIKEILKIEDDEQMKEELGKLHTVKTDLARLISVYDELNIEEGQIISGLGHSWSDVNDKHYEGYHGLDNGIDYTFIVNNVKGYKVQYLDYESLVIQLDDEDVASEIAEVTEQDEVIQGLAWRLDSDACLDEAEVIVSNDTEFEVIHISDERDESGEIVVTLEVVNQ